MKTNNIDFKNYDTLNVYAKKDKIAEIIKCYESFSWRLYESKENDKYADTQDLVFVRPHNIKNKDYLQYTQIEMENLLNKIGFTERKKHSKSTCVGLAIGVLSAGIFAVAIRLILAHSSTVGLVLSILGFVFSAIGFALSTVLSVKMFKFEKVSFKIKQEKLEQELTDICLRVQSIGGVNDEKKQ